jgi:hypothetical protein
VLGRRETRWLQQGMALAGELRASLARACQDAQQRSDISRLTPVTGCLTAKRVKHRIRVQLKQPEQEVVLPGDSDPQGHDRFGWEVFRFSVTSMSARPATAAASTCRSFWWLVMEPIRFS